MNLTRAGIERMTLMIGAHADYTTDGHDCCNRARTLVTEMGQLCVTMSESLHVPDHLIPFLTGSLLDHVIRGYGRPLGYLCSDCRYPKWLLTPAEVMTQYGHVEKLRKEAESPGRGDGFTSITAACPECGD
jgi:hypothetical protein